MSHFFCAFSRSLELYEVYEGVYPAALSLAGGSVGSMKGLVVPVY